MASDVDVMVADRVVADHALADLRYTPAVRLQPVVVTAFAETAISMPVMVIVPVPGDENPNVVQICCEVLLLVATAPASLDR